MSTKRRRRLEIEGLEERLALSTAAAPSHLLAGVNGVVTSLPAGSTLTVLNEFAAAYGSKLGQPKYNAALDLNHNGQIGQTDGKLLLRALPALAPKLTLSMTLNLAPADQVKGHVPINSGGDTLSMDPTIIGHTSPGALVFVGTGTDDFKLATAAVVANAQGYFSYTYKLSNGINQLDFEAVDRYGQQYTRAYPILWITFGQYEAEHPKND